MGKLGSMSALSWDRCVQFAIPAYGSAVAAFAGFCNSIRGQRPGTPMSAQSLVFVGITAAFLCGGLLLTGLAIARHPGAQRWRWKVILAIGIVALAVLASVRFYRDLTPLGQGVLFGIGAVLLLEGLRRFVYGYYVRRKGRLALAEANRVIVEIQPEMASGEAVWRLREAYRSCFQPAFQFAYRYLGADICSAAISGAAATAAGDLDLRYYTAVLIREYVERDIKNSELEMKFKESQVFTVNEFDDLKTAFVAAIGEYLGIVATIKRAGGLFLGKQALEKEPKFSELLQWHNKYREEMAKLRSHSDFVKVTMDFGLFDRVLDQ